MVDSLAREPEENLLRFKMTCLKDRSTLFKNNIIELGVINSIVEQEGQQVLSLKLYLSNKSEIRLNEIKYEFKGSGRNTIVLARNESRPNSLNPHESMNKDIIFDFSGVPYNVVTADLFIK